ncbi:sulfurtransferase TusA family protein [Buchnera aphidicola]|uniref:Small ubiquitous protein n=1 Tax=Buchnera aphidicola subsp. Cinara cedri (strain Cc) TaxID=372461 RepID=Q057G1_BUCCC|nr:sulfurtransferase TusA family protein [Buchnera aphidicola]ABJ90738.1 small ubiquitous protein [Buchnera aphidicola BCc]
MIIKLNLLGLRCPELIIKLRQKVRKLKTGQKILVKANDEFSKKDIKLFCRFMKHKLISITIKKKFFLYYIKIGKKKKY